jgi:hypothetical protein
MTTRNRKLSNRQKEIQDKIAKWQKKHMKRIWLWDDEDMDGEELQKHVGCFSYPMCSLEPNGCVVWMGKNVETFGHKD